MFDENITVSENCIYLNDYATNTRILIDYGTQGELRNVFIYDGEQLNLVGVFKFDRQNLIIAVTSNDGSRLMTTLACKKIVDDKHSIIIGCYKYSIDCDNEKQVELFDELVNNIFK